jgi:hypothetical protein
MIPLWDGHIPWKQEMRLGQKSFTVDQSYVWTSHSQPHSQCYVVYVVVRAAKRGEGEEDPRRTEQRDRESREAVVEAEKGS